MIDPKDERWIALVSRTLEPSGMDATRARAFQARIRERLERGESPSRLGALAVAVTAAVAWIFWFAASPMEVARPVSVAGQQQTVPLERREGSPVVAFAESAAEVYDLGAPDVAPEEYLPDDYLVLAGMFTEDGDW